MEPAAFILTGGRSSRMGIDKALLSCADGTLVERTAATLRPFCSSVTLVGAPERYRKLKLAAIPDLRSNAGPLSGLEAALSHSSAEWNVILACDMPGIDEALIYQLCRHSQQSSRNAVVVRDVIGLIHPLCGAYRRECLPAVRDALDAGRRRLLDFVELIGAEVLDVTSEVLNVNTPEQWHAFHSVAPSHGK